MIMAFFFFILCAKIAKQIDNIELKSSQAPQDSNQYLKKINLKQYVTTKS